MQQLKQIQEILNYRAEKVSSPYSCELFLLKKKYVFTRKAVSFYMILLLRREIKAGRHASCKGSTTNANSEDRALPGAGRCLQSGFLGA